MFNYCNLIYSKKWNWRCFIFVAGLFSIEEFIALISVSPLVISVNTGTVHIACATQTPVIVIYALTNPQHTPWKAASSVLYYSVKEELRSKNQVLSYVTENVMNKRVAPPSPSEILNEAGKLLTPAHQAL